MTIEADTIVTVNAGSSSIKIAVFLQDASLTNLLTISLQDIGQPVATLAVTQPAGPTNTEKVRAADHAEGSRIVIEKLINSIPIERIAAIGHRLVHGGTKYTDVTPIQAITADDWQFLAQLDPQHTPAAQHLVEQFARYAPTTQQVACFDTAFFRDLPHVATLIPIPKKYYASGVRRYGFHGLSYTSLLGTFREQAGGIAANGRVILAHLGSGASITAVRSGQPVDTTMGFTPTSGVTMSTRSGDLDPNIFGFLHRQTGMTVETFDHMVSAQSGLLGVSGITNDMRTLLRLEQDSTDAQTAIELFVHDIKKAIGALATTLNGIDSLIFSGGIGEQSSILRSRICQGLGHLGIAIDDTRNNDHAFLISSTESRVGVHVIPSNEARVIAAQTAKFSHTLKEGPYGIN